MIFEVGGGWVRRRFVQILWGSVAPEMIAKGSKRFAFKGSTASKGPYSPMVFRDSLTFHRIVVPD